METVKEVKTAEDVLVKHRPDYNPNYHVEGICSYYELTQYNKVIRAMEEYASLQNSQLKEALDALQSYIDKADAENAELKKENEILKASLHSSERFRMEDAASHLDDQNAMRERLQAENDRLTKQNEELERQFRQTVKNWAVDPEYD